MINRPNPGPVWVAVLYLAGLTVVLVVAAWLVATVGK